MSARGHPWRVAAGSTALVGILGLASPSWVAADEPASSAASSAASSPADSSVAALAAVRAFVRDVHSARGDFVQTVVSPDAKKTRVSQGHLEFARPNRFRFTYTQPYAQTIVGNGKKIWVYDNDLNQVSVHPMDRALGATPAALLTGQSLEKDFSLSLLPSHEPGVLWVQATPRAKDGPFQSMRVGFRDKLPTQLDVVDSFGQSTTLSFRHFEPNADVKAQTFEFKAPVGADIIEQP